MESSNPVALIIWLALLAIGCFGGIYGTYKNVWYWAGSGGLALFIAILMLHFMKF